ncbi:MAG: transglycosylase domain-containing protein, partial [Lentisphaeria bacterium]|nr:transglycosylase domain-containing protein [Lentisphaeria bacterium]
MRVRSFLQNMMKEKKIFYGLLFPVLFSGIAGATGLLLWHILPFYADDPLEILQKVTPVKCYYDRNMSLVKRERSRQYQWRIPLPLSRISPEAVKVILAAEDANFYKHDGVDLSAILRAAYQNISSGRIISGASTIPMQLAALAMRENKIPRRTVTGKIQQALMARKLVRLYPKQRILEEYLNRIPFGGSIYGIEAAAVYYFGLPAEKLNIAEASLLCGIPQRPGVYRPDKALPLARERQKRVLQMLEKRQIIQKGEWEKIFNDSPLRLRDFSFPSRLAGKEPFIHNMYFRQAVRELAKTERNVPFEIHTALDQEMTGAALDTLKKYASFHPDIKDGAAVLICNRTMEVLVYIGTLDAKEPFTGQVDAAAAVRSAGSTLKPFLYGEGINGGMVSPDTFFHDEPLRYKDYEPANFDGKFRGKVTLEEALQLSLNTTAVKMLEMLGEQRALNLFAALGLRPRSTRKNGLSLALGSAGHTLLELTNAFTVIPNNGVFQKATFLKRESPEKWKENTKRMIWTENTAAALRSVLQRKVPPFGELDAAWKTGTSNGNKDAWCLAATPEYTLGVWFGN